MSPLSTTFRICPFSYGSTGQLRYSHQKLAILKQRFGSSSHELLESLGDIS